MKILVGTKETQGRRASDFSFVDEGDPVTFAMECDRDKNDVDGGCGCRRAMAGIRNGKATTTFKIVESDMDADQLFEALCDHYVESGWGARESIEEYAKDDLQHLQQIVDNFQEGYVLEKRGDYIQVRAPSAVLVAA